MSTKEVSDAFYTKYPLEQHDYPARFKKIASLCTGHVLDLGCGTGTLTKYYAGKYTGFDISPVACALARKNRRKDATFIEKDITTPLNDVIPVPDTIVIAETLEHIKDDKTLFGNLEAWSRIGTKWVISVPNGDRVPDPDHVRTFTIPELRKKLSLYGRVRFYNWEGAIDRIICSVDVGSFEEPLVGLSMIVWNEAVGLERAILSCIDFVDEIFISVDSKTTDSTNEIARRYADEHRHHTWHNDFSRARNEAQLGMKSKWIFFVDGHEFVKSYPVLKDKLDDKHDGFMVRVEMENGGHFFYPRLYRNGIEFKNRVHNLIQTKNVELMPDLVIVHDRITGLAPEQRANRLKQRSRMMPWIFTLNLLKNPNDLRSRYYLARYYQDRKKWTAALRHYRLYLEKTENNTEGYQAAYQAHICALALESYKRALEFLDACDKMAPLRWETYKRRGMIYLEMQNWSQAIINLGAALNESPQKGFDSPEAKLDWHTYERLGFAYFQVYQFKLAEQAWQNALEKDPPEQMKELIKKRLQFIGRIKAK